MRVDDHLERSSASTKSVMRICMDRTQDHHAFELRVQGFAILIGIES